MSVGLGAAGAAARIGALAVIGAAVAVPAFAGEGDEGRLDLPAEHRLGSELAEITLVDRGVQPEYGEPGAGRERADPAEGGGRDPPRGVHREVDRDESRAAERLRVEAFAREVDAAHREARAAQPRRRLGDPEGLASELVGADEHHREALLGRSQGGRLSGRRPIRHPFCRPGRRMAHCRRGVFPECGSRHAVAALVNSGLCQYQPGRRRRAALHAGGARRWTRRPARLLLPPIGSGCSSSGGAVEAFRPVEQLRTRAALDDPLADHGEAIGA